VLHAEHRMIALNAKTYSLGRLWGAGWIDRSRCAYGMETVSRHNGLVAKRGLEVVRQVILGALRKGASRPIPSCMRGDCFGGRTEMSIQSRSLRPNVGVLWCDV